MWWFSVGVSVLGALIEDVSGLTYGAYLEQHIFEPLGMLESGVGYAPRLPERHAEPVLIYRNGTREPIGYHPKHPFFATSGGVYSTAADMAIFMQAQLEAGGGALSRRVMSEEGYRLLQTPRAANAEAPTFPAIAFLVMEREYDGIRTLSHAGNIQTFRSALILAPEKGVGVFASVSGDNPIFSWRDFAARLSGEPGVERVLLPFPVALRIMDDAVPSESVTAPSPASPHVLSSAGEGGAAPDLERFVGDYRPAQRSYGTLEIPFTFRDAVRVRIADDGTLQIGGRSGFRQVASLTFVHPGTGRTAVFTEEDGAIVAFATPYPRYFERVSGLASPRVLQIWHLSVALIAFLGVFAIHWTGGTTAARLAPWCAVVAGTPALGLFVWPWIGLGLATQEMMTEPGAGVFVWAAVGNAVWLFGGVTFILALTCWLPGMTAWRLWQRLAFTLVGLAGLGLVVSAIEMGFFGFRVAGYL